MASETLVVAMSSMPSMSAIVRATFRMWVWARAARVGRAGERDAPRDQGGGVWRTRVVRRAADLAKQVCVPAPTGPTGNRRLPKKPRPREPANKLWGTVPPWSLAKAPVLSCRIEGSLDLRSAPVSNEEIPGCL